MYWYYNTLVRQPYLIVLAITVLCSACIIVSFTTNKLPDFSDATLGFEARGTDIGKRLKAWHNLIEETGPSGTLVADPNDLPLYQKNYLNEELYLSEKQRLRLHNRKMRKYKRKKQKALNKKHNEKWGKKVLIFKSSTSTEHTDESGVNVLSPNASEWNGDSGVFRDYEINNQTTSSEQLNQTEHFEYGRNMTSIDEDYHREKIQTKKSTWSILKQARAPPMWDESDRHISLNGYFCGSPFKAYSHFVVERIGPNSTNSLFDLNGLLSLCQLQDQITNVANYLEYCEKELLTENCCRPWSVANYAALLANKSSCFSLTTEDVANLQNLLVVCFEYFHDFKLSNDCNKMNRCYAPPECTRNNVVFNILHFLVDYNFIKINDTNIYLKYSMIFVPVAQTTKILPLFHEWEKVDLKNDLVQVVAMDLGLENELFNESLLTDSWLVGLGGIFIMASIWFYTGSLFITVMTCVAVCFSLGTAYFIYTLVFDMSFFPYMNLLAVVVIIGIGADDAFIFVKIWQCVLAERFSKSTVTTQSLAPAATEHSNSLQDLMASTLRHAAVSMFVTSLTTAGAFYASYISAITAIKCFGVFAGTSVITNYLLMVTWLPASVSIMERLSSCPIYNKLHIQKAIIMFNKSTYKWCQSFEGFMIETIMNYAWLWLITLSSIGIGGAIIVLYWPGLQLPENAHFRLFVSDHPFEVYNSKLKNEFWFEKTMSIIENSKFPLRFVWGIHPADDGDYANPYSHGSLHYDNNFNISTKAAQTWLLQFCKHIRQQKFYQQTNGVLLPNCFIENFMAHMGRLCFDSMSDTDRTPCCDISKFPYEPHIFELCLPESISSLYTTPREFFIPGVAGPKFFSPNSNDEIELDEKLNDSMSMTQSMQPPLVKVLVIEFESNVSYTTVYQDVKHFVHAVEDWFAKELLSAPSEMRNGWFISDLKFFDLQDTLSRGTLISIGVAMCASLVVLILVTLNVLISLYAVITVCLTIFTTVGILILFGWKLNILESVTVSTAIGLAVDFSLHYGIHYRLSPTSERIAAAQFALSRIIGPTSMAAITTGFAGALMLASNVLPYIQIGIFLVVVMTVSWIYATFFLVSLLKVAGPQYGFMQFNYPKIRKRAIPNGIKYYDRKQSQVIASEQLLTPSSSALGELANSETHELESLTSNSMIKTISGGESTNVFPIDFEHSFNDKASDGSAKNEGIEVTVNSLDYQDPSMKVQILNYLSLKKSNILTKSK